MTLFTVIFTCEIPVVLRLVTFDEWWPISKLNHVIAPLGMESGGRQGNGIMVRPLVAKKSPSRNQICKIWDLTSTIREIYISISSPGEYGSITIYVTEFVQNQMLPGTDIGESPIRTNTTIPHYFHLLFLIHALSININDTDPSSINQNKISQEIFG